MPDRDRSQRRPLLSQPHSRTIGIYGALCVLRQHLRLPVPRLNQMLIESLNVERRWKLWYRPTRLIVSQHHAWIFTFTTSSLVLPERESHLHQ